MSFKWMAALGNFTQDKENIIFHGGPIKTPEGLTSPQIGNFISNQAFGGGVITADIEFPTSVDAEACEFILGYEPRYKAFTSAGLGAFGFCSVRTFSGSRWINHDVTGERTQLKPNRTYQLRVSLHGSNVKVAVDGIDAIDATLPFTLPQGQAGLWCSGYDDIHINNFKIFPEPGKAFVVMQFTPPYNELYSDVIVPVCDELGLAYTRADETYGPGLIIADIAQQIIEAMVIIADITPENPNVYYEVGYSHALNKPTILIAEKPTQLPFDVSPYRVLFYENSIGGKAKVESGLRKHLNSILSKGTP